MRDKLTRRGEAVWQYGGKRYNRNKIFNGRVTRPSNVNIKALNVLYKYIGAFIF
jgi:hypothetical protein